MPIVSDPVMLITGASGGIGSATARMAVAEGYRVALAARSVDRLTALVDELGSAVAMPVPVDVADWAQVSGAVQAVLDRFGRLDAAFANAGSTSRTSFLGDEGSEPDNWREMVLTNVYGVAITARAALPALRASEGHLLLTGSAAGRGVRPGNLYSATKWAVTGMAQSIRAECVGSGVRVTLIQPGLVGTGMISEEQRRKPRLRPEDVANAVRYALTQPAGVDVNEILVRPVGQVPYH